MDLTLTSHAFVSRHTATVKLATRQIDSELDQLALIMAAFKTRLNACAGISCLPPEVMRIIFTLAATRSHHPDFKDPADDFDSASAWMWIRMAHVCACWRDILLGYPQPWADHVTALPPAISTFFERSRDLPLVLRLKRHKASPEGDMMMLNFIMERLPNARILQLDLREEVFRTLLAHFRSVKFPHLTMMSISCSTHTESPELDGHTLQNFAPNLRSVHVQRCFKPWDVSAIVDLKLKGGTWANECFPTLSCLTDLLRQAINLERLRLSYYISRKDEHAKAIVPFTLPRLHNLSLISTATRCSDLLCCMRLDPRVHLDFDLTPDINGSPASNSEVFHLLAMLQECICHFPLNELAYPTCLSLMLDTRIRIFMPANDFPHRIAFRGFTIATDQDVIRIFKSLSQVFFLSWIGILELDPLTDADAKTWSELSALFPDIYTLRVQTTGDGASLTAALKRRTLPLDGSFFLWPSLRVLDIHTCLLADTESFAAERLKNMDFILTVARERAKAGIGLDKIQIDRFNLGMSQVDLYWISGVDPVATFLEKAKKVVPQIVWMQSP